MEGRYVLFYSKNEVWVANIEKRFHCGSLTLISYLESQKPYQKLRLQSFAGRASFTPPIKFLQGKHHQITSFQGFPKVLSL